MSVYQPRLSHVTLSLRPTQHLKTHDGYTPLWETSRQQRGVACVECIPYLAIDRGENDWQREPEVSEPPSALRACLVTKMAEASRFGDETSQRYLGTITDWRVLQERRGRLKCCNHLRRQYMLRDINSCIAGAASSVDTKGKYRTGSSIRKRFQTSPNAGTNFVRFFTYSCNQILCGLNLLANRLLFNQALIASVK